MIPVQIGEWMPDFPPYANPGALVAENVIPAATSYLPFPDKAQAATGVGGRVQGAVYARDVAKNIYNYAGDASALYRLSNLSFTAATRAVGGAYATPIDDFWEFAQWGETVIAVNGSNGDVPQQISLGASNFVNLPGSPPKARHIAVINNFVVLGNVSDSVVGVQRVRWSAINNAQSWTQDATTLADYQDLLGDGGWVQKIVGGEMGGYVIQERAIWRMQFVGSPLVFQFDKIKPGIGAVSPQSVISFQGMVFFLAVDGFYMFDGSTVHAIGLNKVDRTFYADLDSNYAYRVVASIDPQRKLVMWAYPSVGNTGGNPNKILVYHWGLQRWSRISGTPGVGFNMEYLMSSISQGYTLDGLDSISTNVDALPYTLDSVFYTGGVLNLSLFDSNHALNTLNGAPLPATVTTTEISLIPGYRARVNTVWPMVEGNSATVQVTVMTRDVLTQSASSGMALTPNSTGFAQCRRIARYYRFQITTAADTNFDHIQGVTVEPIVDGSR